MLYHLTGCGLTAPDSLVNIGSSTDLPHVRHQVVTYYPGHLRTSSAKFYQNRGRFFPENTSANNEFLCLHVVTSAHLITPILHVKSCSVSYLATLVLGWIAVAGEANWMRKIEWEKIGNGIHTSTGLYIMPWLRQHLWQIITPYLKHVVYSSNTYWSYLLLSLSRYLYLYLRI